LLPVVLVVITLMAEAEVRVALGAEVPGATAASLEAVEAVAVRQVVYRVMVVVDRFVTLILLMFPKIH
jgi:hypothetical protein